MNEVSNKQVSGLSFGTAVEAIKNGERVAREGWNGKNMFIYLNAGSKAFDPSSDRPSTVGGVSSHLFENGAEGTVTRMPNLNMKAADGSTVTGWLASQTDILAEDWSILN
jgi:hypothetical protein